MTTGLAFLLTPAEACEVLRATPDQLEALAADGRLRAVRLTPDGPPRYRSEDVVALVDGLVS
jgi:excisionase family DNA binding protein